MLYGIKSLLKVSKQHIRQLIYFVKHSYHNWYWCRIHRKIVTVCDINERNESPSSMREVPGLWQDRINI